MNEILLLFLKRLRHVKGSILAEWLSFGFRTFIFANFSKLMEFIVLFKFLELRESDRVCDLGCGNGLNTVLLSLRGSSVFGVDISKNAVEWAAEKADQLTASVHYCISDLDKGSAFKPGVFSKLVSICVLQHLRHPNRFLNAARDVMGPGAVLALTVDSLPYAGDAEDLLVDHKRICRIERYYNLEDLKDLLRENGFRPEYTSYVVTSAISRFFYRILMRLFLHSEEGGHPLPLCIFKCLAPFMSAVSILSDSFLNDGHVGYRLVVIAAKVE